MKNVFFRELKNYRKSTIWWSVGIIALMASSVQKFEGLYNSGSQAKQLFDSMPKEFSALFGLNGVDPTTPGGYFAVLALFAALLLGVHAVLLGSGIVAKEESDHTSDFLYVKPESRGAVLGGKLLAALLIIIFLNLVNLAVCLVGMNLAVPGTTVSQDIYLLTPGLFGIQLYFLAVGFAMAAIFPRPKKVGQWAAYVLVIMFIFSSLAEVSDTFGFMKYLSAFQYFYPDRIYIDRAYDPGLTVIAGVTIISLLVASFIQFQRRDIDT
jgi:ABC-2 type transport system permease protein